MTDQTPEPVPLGQVTAALENADGTQNIYITRDPAVNALTLTLTNGLSEAIVFPPGKPVAYDELPPGQSAVYIYFNGLVDNTDIANVHLSEIYPAAPPWAAGTFLDSTTRQQYLVIAPAGQVSLGLGQALTFRLASVLVPGPPCSGTADVMLAGTNVTGLASDTGLPIQIVNPPSPGDQPLLVDLDIGFDTPAVYTGQAQSLTLHLVNQKQDAPLVPGGSDAWQGKTPTFQLTLVYGDGAGALTTVGNAGQIGVGIRNAYGNHWHWHRFPGRQGPYWFLQPDLDGGGTVLGTGANASIEFDVTGIESTLPDGLDSALTVAYVNWYDIPGYRPGSMALTITKKAGPQVTLTADPPWVPPGQSGVPTVLTWDAQQATVVRLDAPDVPPGATFPLSGRWPGQGSINVPLDTTLTATAEKYLSSDSTVTGGEAARPGADVITATARLRIGRAPRTDVSAGLGDLGAIVIPARSASAYLFQRQIGRVRPSQLTKAAVLDLSTHAITGTLDLNSLIPAHGGGTLIQDAAPSPDGRTIHVLASSGDAVTGPAPEFYILPLDVASGAYGRPAPLGTLVPASGLPLGAGLLPSADGNVVFVSVADMKSGDMYISALDAATYAAKPSLSWHRQARPASLSRDPRHVQRGRQHAAHGGLGATDDHQRHRRLYRGEHPADRPATQAHPRAAGDQPRRYARLHPGYRRPARAHERQPAGRRHRPGRWHAQPGAQHATREGPRRCRTRRAVARCPDALHGGPRGHPDRLRHHDLRRDAVSFRRRPQLHAAADRLRAAAESPLHHRARPVHRRNRVDPHASLTMPPPPRVGSGVHSSSS